MTVKKVQKTLNATLEKTEQTLGSIENSLGNNEEAGLLAIAENSEANDGLPEGWVVAALDEICSKITDGSHNPPKDKGEGYVMLSAKNIQKGKIDFTSGGRFINEDEFERENNRTRISSGDLLLTIVGALGRTALVPEKFQPFTLQRSVAVLSAPKVNVRFFKYSFDQPEIQNYIFSNAKGTAQKGIYLKKLRGLEIRLPPLAEQTVIAQTLDTLLAQVDNIKTRLDAIPKILKTFRQSVLASAVSGKLTEEWRGENESTWRSVQLGELISFGPQNGIYKPFKDYGSGTSIVRIDGLYDGELVAWDKFKNVRVTTDELIKWKISVGDILINRVNSIEYLGKCGLVRRLEGDLIFESNIMRITPNSKLVNSDYLRTFLTSYIGLERLRSNAKKAVNQASINQTDVKNTIIEIPDLEEQTEIVRRVEELFAFADQIEQQVKNAQGRVNNLTQSILAKAFRGELTAQWRAENPDLISGDNSAEALLTKIKAERDALKKIKKPKKKTALKKSVNEK